MAWIDRLETEEVESVLRVREWMFVVPNGPYARIVVGFPWFRN